MDAKRSSSPSQLREQLPDSMIEASEKSHAEPTRRDSPDDSTAPLLSVPSARSGPQGQCWTHGGEAVKGWPLSRSCVCLLQQWPFVVVGASRGDPAKPGVRCRGTSPLARSPSPRGDPTGLISARAFFQSLYGGTVHELAELPCQRFGGKRLLEKRGSRLHEATADYFVTSVGADK